MQPFPQPKNLICFLRAELNRIIYLNVFIKTSPLIYLWTGLYMITASVMKELKIGSDKIINFSNQLKYQQFMTCYSPSQFSLFKISTNIPLKWKISTKIVFLQQAQFFPVWSLFCMQAKNYDLLPSLSKKYFWY